MPRGRGRAPSTENRSIIFVICMEAWQVLLPLRSLATPPPVRSAMTKCLLLSLMLAVPATLVAQSHDDMAGMNMHDHAAQPLSATTKKQIDSVAKRAAPLATTAAAAN